MPRLVSPRLDALPSLRGAAQDPSWDDHTVYSGLRDLATDELESWMERLIADARDGSPRPEGFVPATNLWWVDDTRYLGRVQIRHRLNPWLRDFGGHIGYYVVASARRRGHATAMLAAALPVASTLGLECALLTCDPTNVASRRTIEANGGLFADQRGPRLRYWVPTGPPAA